MEDNPADVVLVMEAFKRHDVACEINAISDGDQALRHIDQIEAGATSCPDLVILDLNLPKRPGLDVLKRIKLSAVCARVPIVILTSSDNQRDRESVAFYSPAGYILKPTELSELVSLGAEFKRLLQQ